jgi:hypothetical protein
VYVAVSVTLAGMLSEADTGRVLHSVNWERPKVGTVIVCSDSYVDELRTALTEDASAVCSGLSVQKPTDWLY